MTVPVPDTTSLELHCLGDPKALPEIRPMRVERDWMEATPDRFAYRCLPLNIANSHGWEILCPGPVEAIWSGGNEQRALKLRLEKDAREVYALSHFGCGILTFPVHALIRTPPGHDLWIMGPPNRPKDGIYPLSGVIETDWSPYGFTMNWRMTRAGHAVRFERGEPFAAFFLVPRGLQERITPRIGALDHTDPVAAEFQAWQQSRRGFLDDLPVRGSDAQKAKWQKGYFQGKTPTGKPGAPDHRTQLRLKPFTRDGGE